MVKRKVKPQPQFPSEEYLAMQLTPEQKAAARADLERQTEEIARSGVWELFLQLEGKVHLDLNIDELREDRD